MPSPPPRVSPAIPTRAGAGCDRGLPSPAGRRSRRGARRHRRRSRRTRTERIGLRSITSPHSSSARRSSAPLYAPRPPNPGRVPPQPTPRRPPAYCNERPPPAGCSVLCPRRSRTASYAAESGRITSPPMLASSAANSSQPDPPGLTATVADVGSCSGRSKGGRASRERKAAISSIRTRGR